MKMLERMAHEQQKMILRRKRAHGNIFNRLKPAAARGFPKISVHPPFGGIIVRKKPHMQLNNKTAFRVAPL